MGKRMDDWLRNMGDWNISRRRYFGLPLPFYPCGCGHLNVIGSLAELEGARDRRPRPAGGAAPALDRRRPDLAARSAARRCAASRRSATSGSTPASCRSRRSAGRTTEWIEGGYATGAARGLTGADLPDHAYWEQWFPADWVSEMREQIRLWFYSQLFMSVALVGRAPFSAVLGYEKMLDEDGREMHGSWGNLIEAEEAFERMGADVMRWQYCAQPPDRNLLFGYGPAHEIKRKLLTRVELRLVPRHVRRHRALRAALRRSRAGPDRCPAATARPLAASPARRCTSPRSSEAYESFVTVGVTRAFEAFVEDLSNWYIRRSRRRFWEESDQAAFRTLWYALVQGLRGRGADHAVPGRASLAGAGRPHDARARRRASSWPAGRRRGRRSPTRTSSGRWPRRAVRSSSATLPVTARS